MQQLKRVGWQIGQPLLPIHLVAQEESLLAHLNFYIKNQGLPFYGVGNLKWDNTLLSQGVVAINKFTIIFPSGEIIDVPDNGTIASFDLNTVNMNRVTLYVHLLKESTEQEIYADSNEEEEKIFYSIHELILSTENHLFTAKTTMKLAEFEKDIENRWKLSETYTPPFYTITPHPFLTGKLSTIRTVMESFQKELELESGTGKFFEQRTLNTKLCLIEVAKMRQFLLNVEREVITHPYYLYEQLCQFLSTMALIYVDQVDLKIIPYQHDKLGPLFSKLVDLMIQYLKPKSEQLSHIQFEKRQNCYVSQRLPQDLYEAREIYFIVQLVDPKQKFALEGLKLASYSRLYNTHRFALTGIVLLRLDSAPFNNNFTKHAQVFKIEKDSEWEHGLAEGKVAFSVQEEEPLLQAFLYWK